MVVWLFAGGGASEIGGLNRDEEKTRGLIPFLEKNFANCVFERKLPARAKPGPKPSRSVKPEGQGYTGKSLAEQIQRHLSSALKHDVCDLILVIDDLDCRDAQKQQELLLLAIARTNVSSEIKRYIAFASPEIEAWIIADWDNTIGKDVDFRQWHTRMRWRLTSENRDDLQNQDAPPWKGPKVPFDVPETFSFFNPDKNCCQDKLSDLLIEASLDARANKRYSKAIHTPRLLPELRPEAVSAKCPLFRDFYHYMFNFCAHSK
ncbi:MAG: hypothetical protein U0350_02140 [Caldilineaceae bacterium]